MGCVCAASSATRFSFQFVDWRFYLTIAFLYFIHVRYASATWFFVTCFVFVFNDGLCEIYLASSNSLYVNILCTLLYFAFSSFSCHAHANLTLNARIGAPLSISELLQKSYHASKICKFTKINFVVLCWSLKTDRISSTQLPKVNVNYLFILIDAWKQNIDKTYNCILFLYFIRSR